MLKPLAAFLLASSTLAAAHIFFAKPDDYQKATITLSRSATQPSAIWLPLVDVAQ